MSQKYKLKVQLMPVQQQALNKLLDIYRDDYKCKGAILALNPGDGKTLTALTLAARLRKKILIISKISPIQDWEKQTAIYFDPPMKTKFVGSRGNSKYAAADISWWEIKDIDVLIVNYETLTNCYTEVVQRREELLRVAIQKLDAMHHSTKSTYDMNSADHHYHTLARRRRDKLQMILERHLESPEMHLPIDDEDLCVEELITNSTVVKWAFYYETWDIVVYDEADVARTSKTNCFLACHQLKSNFYMPTTGTPYNNRIQDLESMFLLAHVSPAPGLSWSQVRSDTTSYCQLLTQCRDEYVILNPNPEKTRARYLPVDVIIREKFHNKIEEDIYQAIDAYVSKGEDPSSSSSLSSGENGNMLQGIIRFRQACDGIYNHRFLAQHPQFSSFVSQPPPLPSAIKFSSLPAKKSDEKIELEGIVPTKIRMLLSALPILIHRVEKGIIFVHFKRSIDQIEKHVKKVFPYLRVFRATGDTSQEDREKVRKAFDTHKGPAILITIDIFQSGVNLYAANHVYLYDIWWNPVDALQQRSRCERPEQKKSVFTYQFLIAGTIEDCIYAVAHTKAEFSTLVLRTPITPQLINQITCKNALSLSHDSSTGMNDLIDIWNTMKKDSESLKAILSGFNLETILKKNATLYITNTQEFWITKVPPTQELKHIDHQNHRFFEEKQRTEEEAKKPKYADSKAIVLPLIPVQPILNPSSSSSSSSSSDTFIYHQPSKVIKATIPLPSPVTPTRKRPMIITANDNSISLQTAQKKIQRL